MDRYCITAARHNSRDNHVASSFKVWKWVYVNPNWAWRLQPRPFSAREVVGLLEAYNEVFTATEVGGQVWDVGAPVEVELRISKNESKYPISKMPSF